MTTTLLALLRSDRQKTTVLVLILNLIKSMEKDITTITAKVVYKDNLLASAPLQSHVEQELFSQKPLVQIFPQHVPTDITVTYDNQHITVAR